LLLTLLSFEKSLTQRKFMRRILNFFALNLLLGTTAFAINTTPFAGQCIDGKFYVEPGTVHVAPNGIFLNLDGNFIPVEMVCMDDEGVYVLEYEEGPKNWVCCTRCGTIYDANRYSGVCPHTERKAK
jgi:hypothetical protein